MLKNVLTSSLPTELPGKTKHQNISSYSTFFQHSPSAFAIYNAKEQELTSWNDAFLNLWQCEAFILRETFPNPSLLRIQEDDFSATWQKQIALLESRSQTCFECTLMSKYGESKVIRIELWKMSAQESGLFGMKLDDVTNAKKMALESRKYVRII